MNSDELDRVDMAILHLLQDDARNVTTEEIGEKVGLSSSAVANRIKTLESQGIIIGYAPILDYEAGGFDSHVLVRGTAPNGENDSVIEEFTSVTNVVSVREIITDKCNVVIEVVSWTQDEFEETVAKLNELELEIEETEILKEERSRVFDTYGERFVIRNE